MGETTKVIEHYLSERAENNQLPLHLRKDAKGTKLIDVISIDFMSENKPMLSVQSGQDVEIIIKITAHSFLPNCNLKLTASDSIGSPIFILNNRLISESTFNISKGVHNLVCKIKSLLLTKGLIT